MGNKLYVGNLPYTVRDEDLQQSFSQYGSVSSAKVMMERDTGRSKGFGFVEMGNDAEAQAAIAGMNGQPLGGRSVVVNEARPMEARPPRSGGGGFVYQSSFPVTSGTPYSVTVGNGGGDGNGQNSVFSSLTAIGGGQGGRWNNGNGQNGGSGGGGGNSSLNSYGGNGGSGIVIIALQQ
jgi:RNA recognition motif-containing protein